MEGIYWAAVVVTVLGAGEAAVLWATSGRRWDWLLPLALALPLSPVVNLWVKTPILHWLSRVAGQPPYLELHSPLWYVLLILFLAPVTEEAIKLVPLAFPAARRQLLPGGPVIRLALASGLGFGLGEAWYLAYSLAVSGRYAGLSVGQFGGYINERALVLFAHGAMTLVVLLGILAATRASGTNAASVAKATPPVPNAPATPARLPVWKRVAFVAAGYAGAIFLHALGNVGALLYQLRILGPVPTTIVLLVFVVLLGVMVERVYLRSARRNPPPVEVLWEAAREDGKDGSRGGAD